jgi:DNA adenine methylase
MRKQPSGSKSGTDWEARFNCNRQPEVKVLENFLAPTDFTLGDTPVRKGTWLLGVRVLGDELWEKVKSGELTGFSIGGSARRVPEPTAPRNSGQAE